MAKITDTLKRVIKFEDVTINDGQLTDETGSIVEQITGKLPKGVTYFDVQVTAAILTNVEDGESEDVESEE